jgi:hypothetical protein
MNDTDQTQCPDCGGENLTGPDREGFLDCIDCGAAWLIR